MTDSLVRNMAKLVRIRKSDAFRHQQIIKDARENHTKYTDPDFPPQEISLIRRPDTPAKWKTFVWRRATEFLPADKVKVFDQIDPNDILQGQLGDCYFLSCLSALAERPNLIQRLFLTEEANEAGCYAVWLNDNGEWRNFVLDDYFPCLGPRHGPAFTRSNGPELWVLLLEKAYAKMHGSYDIIEGGDPAWALRDLTGAPWDFIDSTDPNEVWNYIMESERMRYLITCYTRSTDVREEQNPLGIVFGHAYSILDAKEIITEGGTARLIRIRNPWGKFEWKGDWGDESDKWTEHTKSQVCYENKDDGTFWMSVTDFVKYYEGVGTCKLHENYQYKSISFDHSQPGKDYSLLRLVVPEKTHIFLSVNQKDDRGFDQNLGYQYSTVRIMLGKIEENGLTYVDGKFFTERNVVLENVLESGYYMVVVEYYWRQNIHKKFNISAYSEKKIDFEEVVRADIGLIQRNLLKNYAFNNAQVKKKNYSNLGGDAIEKFSGNHLGMIFFYYNNQEDDKQLHETVTATKLTNLKIQSPFTDSHSFTVKVMPRDDCVVVYKIINEAEAFAFSQSVTNDVLEPSFNEIEAHRREAYRTTTYIDDPNDKTEESRDISYFDDYIKSNVDVSPDDPTNLADIVKKNKKSPERPHYEYNPQKDLANQFEHVRQQPQSVPLEVELAMPKFKGLFDKSLWANFPQHVSDDSRLGRWAITGIERSFCDVVNPIFSCNR